MPRGGAFLQHKRRPGWRLVLAARCGPSGRAEGPGALPPCVSGATEFLNHTHATAGHAAPVQDGHIHFIHVSGYRDPRFLQLVIPWLERDLRLVVGPRESAQSGHLQRRNRHQAQSCPKTPTQTAPPRRPREGASIAGGAEAGSWGVASFPRQDGGQGGPRFLGRQRPDSADKGLQRTSASRRSHKGTPDSEQEEGRRGRPWGACSGRGEGRTSQTRERVASRACPPVWLGVSVCGPQEALLPLAASPSAQRFGTRGGGRPPAAGGRGGGRPPAAGTAPGTLRSRRSEAALSEWLQGSRQVGEPLCERGSRATQRPELT
ncbi:translation initiation factor IF-2-like [Felis catus]|uniref:translation initiation factor IF-2-like n=1 Tax=Felis catus TaxID=9685 RepID=UPI001D1997C8|nr:translation initiation factor IF-2-like [Felis catus]